MLQHRSEPNLVHVSSDAGSHKLEGLCRALFDEQLDQGEQLSFVALVGSVVVVDGLLEVALALAGGDLRADVLDEGLGSHLVFDGVGQDGVAEERAQEGVVFDEAALRIGDLGELRSVRPGDAG